MLQLWPHCSGCRNSLQDQLISITWTYLRFHWPNYEKNLLVSGNLTANHRLFDPLLVIPQDPLLFSGEYFGENRPNDLINLHGNRYDSNKFRSIRGSRGPNFEPSSYGCVSPREGRRYNTRGRYHS